ncbi:MAG: DNA topoisomerase IV subunit A [Bacilli bacterium]|nr:DNA topoisomerase IV subunit A [Bacilli bacterium]
MAKKKEEVIEEIIEKISVEPLEDVMGDRYATYAKYVIQDRAIPDVRDGLKPVQRRIIFSMYKSGNTFNKPTKKCAHTVGAVMGTFHPHGDTSIYEALARMSQDWKVRYPLIDFQGNNGSIDGDSPAAYRYTESRLSELSNELIRDIEKKTVDMQLNFDDTEYEPIVLPSRFPNLLVNGTEGIAVALATEIPPHNLREVIDATIYRIGHKMATCEDLLQFVKGPDFPGGGIIYESEGLKNIYLTGRGKIEVGSKAEIVQNKDNQQIIITEIPYKVVKKDLVYEIDKIIHAKSVSGLIEVRDESDYKGIRIAIDCKKDAKVELLLKYLKAKTPLVTSYSANMVAIVNGRPRTLTLLDFIDSYIEHQVDVVTRQSKFDLEKFSARLHIVEGLIKASLCINEVVEIIKKSKDKADSKVNLMKHFGFSNEQAEAIVTMPLYKLSHTDEITLEKERKQLEKDIQTLKDILEDPAKLNRVLIKDLKQISAKYGDDRRTQIEQKEEDDKIDKRQLIAEEETIVVVTRDGYAKRCSIKSYKGSGDDAEPGLKDGDAVVAIGQALTTDYLICFTNIGNYCCIPVHKLTENRFKDEGVHLNTLIQFAPGEKIIKAIALHQLRSDVYLAFLTRFGQIKRMSVSGIETFKRSRPARCMKLLNGDEVVGIQILTGNSNLLVLTSNGMGSLFNENDLTILGPKAGGVKSISGLGKNQAAALIAAHEDEKAKAILITDKGHERVIDINKITRTARLGKPQEICPSFKGDPHKVLAAIKVERDSDLIKLNLHLNDNSIVRLQVTDFKQTEAKYAKGNIKLPSRTVVSYVFDTSLDRIDKNTISYPIIEKIKPEVVSEPDDDQPVEGLIEEENVVEEPVENAPVEPQKAKEKKEDKSFEQISIFDVDDE